MKARGNDAAIDGSIYLVVILILFYLCLIDGADSRPKKSSSRNDLGIEISMQRRLEEEIQRKIDAIKSEIKHEIEERERIRMIQENNAKFDELLRDEKLADTENSHRRENLGDEVKRNAEGRVSLQVKSDEVKEEDERIRRKRDGNGDDNKCHIVNNVVRNKASSRNQLSNKDTDINYSLENVSKQRNFLFVPRKSELAEPAVNRFVNKRNVRHKIKRSPSRIRRRSRRRKRPRKRNQNFHRVKLKRSKINLDSAYDATFPKIASGTGNRGTLCRYKRV